MGTWISRNLRKILAVKNIHVCIIEFVKRFEARVKLALLLCVCVCLPHSAKVNYKYYVLFYRMCTPGISTDTLKELQSNIRLLRYMYINYDNVQLTMCGCHVIIMYLYIVNFCECVQCHVIITYRHMIKLYQRN